MMAKTSTPLFSIRSHYRSVEIRICYGEIIIDDALIIEELFVVPLKKPKLTPEVTNPSP